MDEEGDNEAMIHMDSIKTIKKIYKIGYANGAKDRRDKMMQHYFEIYYRNSYNIGNDLGILKCLIDNLALLNNKEDQYCINGFVVNSYIEQYKTLLNIILPSKNLVDQIDLVHNDATEIGNNIGCCMIEPHIENFIEKCTQQNDFKPKWYDEAKQLYFSILKSVLSLLETENNSSFQHKIYQSLSFFL